MSSTFACMLFCAIAVASVGAFYVPQSMRAGVKGYDDSRLARRGSDVIERYVFHPFKASEHVLELLN